MQAKIKKLRFAFIIYWFLLAYIIAALIWWFIALTRQNEQMANFKIQELKARQVVYNEQIIAIEASKKRKQTQYIGEGITFFLLIAAGAVFVFRAVRRQLQFNQEQQHFMMALAHELKTPIAVAKLNLETLQKRKLEEPQQQRLIQITLQEANRLNSLCNNMLLSSQIEASNFKISAEEINLSRLVNECVQDFIPRYSGKKFFAQIKEEVFTSGDELLLQMAINNLVDNAIKYSHKEATVTVTLTQQQNTILLQVYDEGKGIAAEEKGKIFIKFYRIGNTATKAAKGTGLGLYLTKRIVEQHNGNISVTDNIPAGCIFTITLQSSDKTNTLIG
jgi:two-component system, OmpR family, sensor histidine kinase CiaH